MQSTKKIPIPEMNASASAKSFVANALVMLKSALSKEVYLDALNSVGIKSRATWMSLVRQRRNISPNLSVKLGDRLDLSHNEKQNFKENVSVAKVSAVSEPQASRIVVPELLSNPLHTIVLNFCSLASGVTLEELSKRLEYLASLEEIKRSLTLLVENELISRTEDGKWLRIDFRILDTLPGYKAEASKTFMRRAQELAWLHYDLPLTHREYASFTSRIAKADMGKLKDLVRQFRRDVYALRSDSADSVVHVNLHAFTIENNLE